MNAALNMDLRERVQQLRDEGLTARERVECLIADRRERRELLGPGHHECSLEWSLVCCGAQEEADDLSRLLNDAVRAEVERMNRETRERRSA